METFILILGVFAIVATLLAAYFLGKAEKYRKHNYTGIANDYYTACFACVGFILLFFIITIISLTMKPDGTNFRYMRVCQQCGNTFETDDKVQQVCSPCLDEILKEYNLSK